jgi:hypothetical protein
MVPLALQQQHRTPLPATPPSPPTHPPTPPPFPHVTQVLQALTQGDSARDDGSELLGVALQCARDRVVVKRSKRLQPLVPLGPLTPSQARPAYSVPGTTTRFDVYLAAH